jgi:hypothetical protein
VLLAVNGLETHMEASNGSEFSIMQPHHIDFGRIAGLVVATAVRSRRFTPTHAMRLAISLADIVADVPGSKSGQ